MQLPLDPNQAYAAVAGRDSRWDGRLFLGVVTTGIYCRPSCPARTPKPENCCYFPTAAAAVAGGFRACRRCRPDTAPGSRVWGAIDGLVARGIALIENGFLDDEPVTTLARRLGVTQRHLRRVMVTEVGASPQQLAVARRTQVARMLIDHTGLTMSDIAFAAGFGSIRQFNDVMRQSFGAAPGSLRASRTEHTPDGRESPAAARLVVRLAYRRPLAASALWRTLAAHAIAGVEEVHDDQHIRVMDTQHGPAVAQIQRRTDDSPGEASPHVPVSLLLTDIRAVPKVIAAVRRWLDLDADPEQVDDWLIRTPLVGPLVADRPGLRVPGCIDGAELAVCAVLGQQVSVARAVALQSRLVGEFGPIVDGALGADRHGQPWRMFPRPELLAQVGPTAIRDAADLTKARATAVHAVASAVASGLDLGPGSDVDATVAALRLLPGIGPWTAGYVAVRALGDPDGFMPGDLVVRRSLARLNNVPQAAITPLDAETASRDWRPWRAYAQQHLWTQEVYQ